MSFWTMPLPGLMRKKAGGLNVDEVFSTYLYTGNGTTQTINNGIDLAGEGGLVWFKKRNTTQNHILVDTLRGNTKFIYTDLTNSEGTAPFLPSFNVNGFTINSLLSDNGGTYTSWTFRRAPKFFDVVTYTGNGASGRQIAHGLGVVPGMVIIKRLDALTNWIVAHRGMPGYLMNLNLTNSRYGGSNIQLGDETTFTVNSATVVNASGGQYVAYLFAHDPSPEGIVQCGSYVGNGLNDGPTINIGWPPQYLLIKRADGTGNWTIFDSQRGYGSPGPFLQANTSNADGTSVQISPTATGFKLVNNSTDVNASGTYIYMAIRAEGV